MQPRQTPCRNRLLAASIPGGPAPHFRVQIIDQRDHSWRLHSSFRKADLADTCARDLEAHGLTTRVVASRIIPTAA